LEVPEANEYRLVYDLDLAKLGVDIMYDADHSGAITGPFDRIAYFVELTPKDGKPLFLYVSMDAFSDDLKLVGVPTLVSGAHFQQTVGNMNIWTNKGAGAIGLHGGHIEFWPNNYAQKNAAEVEGASSQIYDFGDEAVAPADGYGSMQVHDVTGRRTLFAINHWRAGTKADIGIGNQGKDHSDWTFSGNAGDYAVKRLRVLVREKE
jgi:sialate O-acetylesterase